MAISSGWLMSRALPRVDLTCGNPHFRSQGYSGPCADAALALSMTLSGHSAASFNHLVGALQQEPWHVQPKRLGGLEIDYEVELGRLLHWDVGGIGAL
jgi:hypothetical protein